MIHYKTLITYTNNLKLFYCAHVILINLMEIDIPLKLMKQWKRGARDLNSLPLRNRFKKLNELLSNEDERVRSINER